MPDNQQPSLKGHRFSHGQEYLRRHHRIYALFEYCSCVCHHPEVMLHELPPC